VEDIKDNLVKTKGDMKPRRKPITVAEAKCQNVLNLEASQIYQDEI
jgi:hypothetical protein